MSKYLYSLLFLCTCLTGCSEDVEIYHAKYLDDIFPNSNGQQPFSSDYLYSADPIADARKAIEKGDLHIYASYSGGPYTPGIKRGCVSDENIVPIKGTSHGYENYKQAQFNTLADLYAEYYNSQIEIYLISNGNKCLSWIR